MINVLIVDDEPFIRQGLKILIDWNYYGYEIVAEASNGIEAIKEMNKKHVDLVICDIKMPEMNGIELIEYINKNLSHKFLKIIMLSGYYEFEYAKKAIRNSVKDYILKPIEKSELIKALESFREQYAVERKKEKEIYDINLSLILSNNFNEENINYVKERLNYKEYFRYISIEVNSISSEEYRCKKQKEIYKEIIDWVEKNNLNVSFNIMNNKDYDITFIYSKNLSDERGLNEKEYIIELKDVINKKLDGKFSIYVGQKVNSIFELSKSYKSTSIIKLLFKATHKVNIIYYEEMDNKNEISFKIVKQSIDNLIKHIEDHNEEEIEKSIDKFYNNLNSDFTNIDIIKIYTDYLLCNLINIINELSQNYEECEVIEYITNNLFVQAQNRESAYNLKKFCIEFSTHIKNMRDSSTNDILISINKEIAENYMQNLTLKFLSEKYYLNSAYLGQLFKKNYNKSFKDYLNEYRIEKAATMLKRSNEKIYRIAEAVGYNNTDYFISKFVQLKNNTPLQYRRQFR